MYEAQTNTVHVPCLKAGTDYYKGDFDVITDTSSFHLEPRSLMHQ